MSTKNDKKNTENRTEYKVENYLARAQLSGNPLLVSNKGTRIYSNSRINGTTSILLAVLRTAGDVVDKAGMVRADYLEAGLKILREKSFDVSPWKTLKTNYAKIGGNSSSPEKKLGPVVSGLIREIKAGNLLAFDIKGISDSETRKLFGYKI